MSDPAVKQSAWRVVAAATALNFPFGSLYAFSVFLKPLETLLGLTRADLASLRARIDPRAPERWEDRGFSYAAALSLTEFLERERGFDLVVELLDRLASGAGIDASLLAVYGDDYRGVCRRWAESIVREAGA